MDLLQKVFVLLVLAIVIVIAESPRSRPSGLAVQRSHCPKDLGFLPCPARHCHTHRPTPQYLWVIWNGQRFARRAKFFYPISPLSVSWQDDGKMIKLREREREYVSHASGSQLLTSPFPFS